MSRAFRLEPLPLPPPSSHLPTFAPSPIPLGWERCRVCGQLVDQHLWASTTCPGPRPEAA
jgi:hypothetical protein